MIPLITCEIPFGKDVCELLFGVHVFDFWNDFFIRGPFSSADSFDGFTLSADINKSCEQVMSRSTSLNLAGPCRTKLRVQTQRSGQVRMNRMVQTSQLRQGRKKGYKSRNTNEDTATVASPLWHGPSALNRAMTIRSLEFPVRSPVPAQLRFP